MKVKAGTRRQSVRQERIPNNVQRFREDRLMSKAELAKHAGLSVLTVERVEQGKSCRMSPNGKSSRRSASG